MPKYIFVTGGVVSSVGKGIAVASIGNILKSRQIKVSVQKLDPYLNVDPGTMSPYQHGEVFVTTDGAETDLDLGNYERFIDIECTADSNTTSGQIYSTLITRERRGDFLGGTIQIVPHLTNEIKDRFKKIADKYGDKYGPLDFPILLADKAEVPQSYGIWATPQTFFIDPNGIIKRVIPGRFETPEEIESILKSR